MYYLQEIIKLFQQLGIFYFIICGVFFFAFLVQLYYWLFIFRKFPRIKYQNKKKQNDEKPPVSVIIAARNEADNLQEYLPFVLSQKYHAFEVVVVNDCSEDDSEFVLAKFQEQYANLHVTTIKPDQKFTHGKKLALSIGIKAAKHEWLLFIDADCYPSSDYWIEHMANNFHDDYKIVLGYGGYNNGDGFLNKLIRYDSLLIAIQYISLAIKGIPYMGVGRNLAYRKSLFFESKGFASHAGLLSGDDDLFVNQNAKKNNTAVEFSKESFTFSKPKTSWYEWKLQKSRHFSTFKFYKFKHKFVLGLEPITRYLFFLGFGIMCTNLLTCSIAAIPFILRYIIQLVKLKNFSNYFNQKNLIFIHFFFDLFLPILHFGIAFGTMFNKKRKWK